MTSDAALRRNAYGQLAGFFVGLALLIQLPAWSPDYWSGWIYWLVFCACCLWITFYFLARSPDLIARRLDAGPGAESRAAQKVIQALLGGVFVAIFIVAGSDHRFGWSAMPVVLVILGEIGVAIGFLVVFLTFDANRFAAATIKVDEGQTVITTGPYAVVRHPMYAGGALLIMASPLALGSYFALIPAALLVAGICWRLLDEERFLIASLPRYAEYRGRTRFRLVPWVW